MSQEYILLKTELSQLIEKTQVVEKTHDYKEFRRLIKPFWKNLNENPDFGPNVDPKIEAELLRLCAWYLCFSGQSTNLKYQDHGKDLVSRSVEMFERVGETDRASRAKMLVASTYFNAGQINEALIVLDDASSTYDNDGLHPMNLMLLTNKLGFLLWSSRYQEALEVLGDIEIPMELCEDPVLLARYKNNAGMLFGRIDKIERAKGYYEEAIELSRKNGNLNFVGNILNNLAFGLIRAGRIDEAMTEVNEAIEIFEELKLDGWLAITYETKSQILMHQHKEEAALETINRSIELFEKGEHFAALADAYWFKTHILLRLGRKEDGFMQFAKLTDFAAREIGEYAVKKFANAFSKIIYVKTGRGFADEVSSFKSELLMESLTDVDADMGEAAKNLKVSKKKLANTINKQFPEIYLELGVMQGYASNLAN